VLLDGFLDYVEREVFVGGCFFGTTSAEFKNRPGAVRDRITGKLGLWQSYLAHAVEQAQEAGELDPSLEARRLAFELNAFVQNAVVQHERFFADARAAVRDRLESARAAARRAA
jgi:hypothetical protein